MQDISDIADDTAASNLDDVYVLVQVQFHLFHTDKLSLTKDVNLNWSTFEVIREFSDELDICSSQHRTFTKANQYYLVSFMTKRRDFFSGWYTFDISEIICRRRTDILNEILCPCHKWYNSSIVQKPQEKYFRNWQESHHSYTIQRMLFKCNHLQHTATHFELDLLQYSKKQEMLDGKRKIRIITELYKLA